MSKPKPRTSFNSKYPKAQRIGQCRATGKVQYASEAEAHKDVRRVRKKYGSRLIPYFCKYCGAWHNGHDRPNSRRSRLTPKEKSDLYKITPRVDPSLIIPPEPTL